MTTSLQRMKQQLETLRMRRQTFKSVPTPEIISIFNKLNDQNRRRRNLENKKDQIIKLKKWIAKFKSQLEREEKAYEERQQILKDNLLIHKAFLKTLSSGYEETRKNYQQVELVKTLIGAYRRCYLFRLAEIFLNDSALNLFKDYQSNYIPNIRPDSKSIAIYDNNDELSGTSLSYSMLLVYCISRIFNIQLLNEYIFKGSKSYLLTPDKSQTVHLYRTIGNKSTQNALKLCSINISQVFDALGLNSKIKNHLSFKHKVDILSQYLISTDMQQIQKLL